MTVNFGWGLGVALVVLTGLVVAVSIGFRLKLTRDVLIAAFRATVQLALVSLIIAGAVQNVWLAIGFALVMFAVAVRTTTTRVKAPETWPWAALAMAAGVLPVLAIIFLSGASPFTGAAIIPIAGIIIGNTMNGHTLMGRRCFAALRDDIDTYEAALAIGLPRRQAVALVLEPHRTEALIPNIDTTKTVGLVTLPGAFVGVLLGGGSAIQAGAAQLLVLFGIMATQFLTVNVALWLVGRGKDLPEDLRTRLRP
ncbi:ABC transporter permease [Propioniferax innocua]|uniref:Putative ABC transport system permease protein n=1 Tax=Propioniferax innocua TaxID=1753 RepID=A0A542ZQV5_9ACTN|nr:ABC transporter permease [Propioniferax innocua]TQL62734.1 putative ABC transport system permease protein [Propioniferax innocua]